MRAAPPLVFPSSRVLAGWWRQLAPLAPRSLAVGHLLLHHVEALVLSERGPPSTPSPSFVLRALTLSPPRPLADLEDRLHLGRQFLGRILGDLAAVGLAEADAAGRWHVTAAGRSLVEGGRSVHAPATSAGPFTFATPRRASSCRWTADGSPVAPPAVVVRPRALRRCIDQSSDTARAFANQRRKDIPIPRVSHGGCDPLGFVAEVNKFGARELALNKPNAARSRRNATRIWWTNLDRSPPSNAGQLVMNWPREALAIAPIA